MEYKNILFEVKDDIAYITMNRPKQLNALNDALLNELDDIMDQLYSNRQIRGIIITGSGRSFIAGADITELKAASEGASPYLSERFMDNMEKGHRILGRIEHFPQPVVAAVNGFALGGGCELALCCDIRIASTKAVFGLPESTLGMIPCYGGTQRLSRLVGAGIAKEILYTGRQVKAEEAKTIGLANRVVEPEELIPAAEEFLNVIKKRGPIAIKNMKAAVNRGLDMPIEDALRFEKTLGGVCIGSADGQEGIDAFIEKRSPVFRNC